MASITFSIETEATGQVSLAVKMSEDDAQRIFAMILASYPPTMPEDDGGERPRKLGECLADEVRGIVNNLMDRVINYEKNEQLKAIMDPVPPTVKYGG